ncbi:MAG: YbaB/EbfC family nucleoid-associated protein [Planctomycetota bacterium]
MARGANQFGNLMKQAQEMQKKMAQVQDDLANRVVEGSAGGGMVTAQVNGKMKLVALKIDPEVVDPDDVEMLEDLIIAAVSQASKKAEELAQEEMSKVTGGLAMPGMF